MAFELPKSLELAKLVFWSISSFLKELQFWKLLRLTLHCSDNLVSLSQESTSEKVV